MSGSNRCHVSEVFGDATLIEWTVNFKSKLG